MKPSIIANWKYQKPTKGGGRGLKSLLKYTSYREDPEHSALPLNERWTDCGLGSNWREVWANCQQWAGPYVLAHHLVIAPAPDLMVFVPEDRRVELVRDITERVIERWHIERGLNVPEYAYCVHDRDTNDSQIQNLHTHVFVAGTIENNLGERESHRVNREQVVADPKSLERADNLHHIAREEFELLLHRTLDLDWRTERELQMARDEVRQGVDQELDFEDDFVPKKAHRQRERGRNFEFSNSAQRERERDTEPPMLTTSNPFPDLGIDL